jgi:hypothetical protein
MLRSSGDGFYGRGYKLETVSFQPKGDVREIHLYGRDTSKLRYRVYTMQISSVKEPSAGDGEKTNAKYGESS